MENLMTDREGRQMIIFPPLVTARSSLIVNSPGFPVSGAPVMSEAVPCKIIFHFLTVQRTGQPSQCGSGEGEGQEGGNMTFKSSSDGVLSSHNWDTPDRLTVEGKC